MYKLFLNLLSANFTKWPNALKQFVGNLPTNWLSVFGYFVGLALKGLTEVYRYINGLNSHPYLEQIWIEFDTYKANKLWNLLPENLKSSPSLTLFQNEIKFSFFKVVLYLPM